jgi:nucleotide-binding universal stress UspA family protein
VTRLLTPVVEAAQEHLEAACLAAASQDSQVVALIIGLVPSSLPLGAAGPERWSRLEYEAARARRRGRELGCAVETVLALADSAPAAVLQLADEVRADAICLAYRPGLRAALGRWRDPLWRTLLSQAPCPILLQRPTADPAAAVRPGDRAALPGLAFPS